MDTSVLDVPALLLAILVAGAITTALLFAFRNEDKRRTWIVGGILVAAVVVLGVIDLAREAPRETHLATPFAGGALPILGALGMVRGTRGVRPWLRWSMVFLTAFVLLFAGLLI